MPPDAPAAPPAPPTRTRHVLVATIVALALASLAYRLLVARHLEQTSALFIGLPTLVAIPLALTRPPRSVLGMIMKVMTLALLMSGIALGEGAICILMAAPLFYLVGLVIGLLVDRSRRSSRVYCVGLVAIAPMMLEGVSDRLSFPRDEVVSREQVLALSASEVEVALARAPRWDAPLPLYLRLGFPRPQAAHGEGLGVGDVRSVRFAGGEGQPGDLVVEVAERAPGLARMRVISDGSHIAHWLAWQQAELRWEAVDPTHSRVRVTLRYRRLLDPAWYFGPWERYAVGLTADYLAVALTRG